ASLMSLLTVRNPIPFYHEDLLSEGIANVADKENIQAAVRKKAEERLQQAYQKDRQPHYLLRDTSSLASSLNGYVYYTLSFITCGGDVKHTILIHAEKENLWQHNLTQTVHRNLEALIEKFVPYGTPLRCSKLDAVPDSGSYSLY